MADSTSPEPQDAAAPSALTASSDPTTADTVRRTPVPYRKPLPDAVAIDLVAVPDAAPAFDDAPPATRDRQAAAVSDAADVSRAIAAMADASRASAGGPGQGEFAGHWPSQFAQVLAETLAGSRPPSQLAPWTTQQTRRRISQLGPVLSTAHRPRVKRLIVTSPTGGVLEMAVIVGLGTRVRAVAVRLERAPSAPSARPGPAGHPGWICTAVEAA
jgi:hypothetical protein